jgi:hypothetical protein
MANENDTTTQTGGSTGTGSTSDAGGGTSKGDDVPVTPG